MKPLGGGVGKMDKGFIVFIIIVLLIIVSMIWMFEPANSQGYLLFSDTQCNQTRANNLMQLARGYC